MYEMSDPHRFIHLSGSDLEPYLTPLAQLRIEVFNEFPYLYDGDLEYERKYLKTYLDCADSLVILVEENEEIVGASTCLPLAAEVDEIKQPFLTAQLGCENIFYFGESIIKSRCRGRGWGKEFFRRREEHALSVFGDLRYTFFCAVSRGENHPMAPVNYRKLDHFWERQGYLKEHGMSVTFSWKDQGDSEETEKSLDVWLKEWTEST